ncbi:hypothetical protein K6119_01185 [Paracrocinitomix mangrovi]|uniref:hypothetical protein n=1 Tax=Paracrocinitomix mangrovi TaxID=2862509 RepID=UPI001C8E2B39|nr:hypothetical protein [Paracrocinitomix mangrovi]UKN02129.1 hypothetical protein K6119_01185 [Paracrocinitomix mangrovi]
MRQLLTVILFIPAFVFANQKDKKEPVDSVLIQAEDSISIVLNKLRASKDDGERDFYNIELKNQLEKILEHPGVMDYPFDKLSSMSTIKSPDGAFRIFNWNVEDQELNHSHYCYVVKPTFGSKPNKVYELKEDKITLGPRPGNVLTTNTWYGALYYKIIPVQRGNKTYYTIIGFSGEDRATNQKMIDVFYFKGRSLRMGYPLFQEGKDSKQLVRRVFFQYSEKAVISVNQNDKLGGIVFDHLVPEKENLADLYDFYIPDMTYDAYRWDGEIWRYIEDVVAYNDSYRRYRTWRPTADGDSSTYALDNNFWINPIDAESPIDNGGDVPIAPVEDMTDEKAQKKKERKEKKNKGSRKKFKEWFKRKPKNRSAIRND